MVTLKCSECGEEFEFPLFTPTPGRPMRCVDCEESPIALAIQLGKVTDKAQRSKILKRIAALKSKPKPRKRF